MIKFPISLLSSLPLSAKIELKTVRTTDHHLQTKGKVERFKATIISRLRHYNEDPQNYWDTFGFHLTGENNI